MKINDTPVTEYAKFLYHSGLLFEINRKVLHPFGFALSVVVDKGEVTGIQLHDYSHDPEGILFDEKAMKTGLSKFKVFLEKFGDARLKSREKILGFRIQPYDDSVADWDKIEGVTENEISGS